MRSVLNANTVFATVILARQASHQLIVVVEGEDDHFIIKDHINSREVMLISGSGGKQNVLDAAAIADVQGVRGVRFLIDADYDRFVHPALRYPPNAISSKHHDAVMDIVIDGTVLLDRVIDSHSRAGRRNGAAFTTKIVREQAIGLASTMASLRIVNERKGHGLRLHGFPFSNLITLPPSNADLASIAVGRSSRAVTQAALEADLSEEISQVGVHVNFLVGDHDLFKALSRVLKDVGVIAGADALWSSFLAGILCAHLGATDWYAELSAWAETNGRSMFACPCAA